MATNPTQYTQQAYLVPGEAIRPTDTPFQLELFDQDGNPVDLANIVSRLEALENPPAP